MKEYNFKLKCATCGSENCFEYNEDKSYVKCFLCNREYFGGVDEVKTLNENMITDAFVKQVQKEYVEKIKRDLRKYLK